MLDQELRTTPGTCVDWRHARIDDLEACFSLTRERSIYDAASRRSLLDLWKHLLEKRACVAVVLEDRTKPLGSRIAGFGMSFFATDEFIREAKENLPPYIPLRAMEWWKRGQRAFLLEKEIRSANSGTGLNLVVSHYSWDGRRRHEENYPKVYQVTMDSFFATHAGYRIKEFVQEVYGVEDRQMVESGGLQLYRDYAEFGSNKGFHENGKDTVPFLVGLHSDEVRRRPGFFAVNPLFSNFSPPRFHFRPVQQSVLERALKGESDTETAESLDISPWTVKKRWQGIYAKVESVDPGLLGPQELSSEERAKRRYHLLEYLRSHHEELRPY